MNRKQVLAIKSVAADWCTVCSQTAHQHNMTPEEAFANPELTADFIADELGKLVNGHPFLSIRKGRKYDPRNTWNEAVYIVAGCFPEMQLELVHHLADAPKKKSFSISAIKRGLRKLIGK